VNGLKVGFGVITYNRPDNLAKCLIQISENTPKKDGYHFAVFDDGSPYSINIKSSDMFKVFQGKVNHGVVVNKNRALYYFAEINPVDIIIMLEDDTSPDVMGWEQPWIKATEKFGHINYRMDSWTDKYINSKGTTGEWDSPHEFTLLTGQVHGVKVEYIKEKIGYMHPGFKGWGYAHCEWTERFLRNNLGGSLGRHKAINDGISLQKSETHKNRQQMEANRKVRNKLIQNKQGFVKEPWLNDEQKKAFLQVFESAV